MGSKVWDVVDECVERFTVYTFLDLCAQEKKDRDGGKRPLA